MQDSEPKNDKKAYTRPKIMGFYIKNPPQSLGDPIKLINESIIQTKPIQLQHQVKDIHYIVFESHTAVRIRIQEQQYMSGWKKIIGDIFSEFMQSVGSDYVLELHYHVSEEVKQIFRDMERDSKNKSKIYTIQEKTIQVLQSYISDSMLPTLSN